jgi:dGTPase
MIETTRGRIEELGIETVDDVRNAGQTIGGFSDALAARERTLKAFMYANLYHHPEQVAAAEQARVIIADLFAAYSNDTALMPQEWRATMPSNEPQRSRHIADFLAGMTDRFATNSHQAIFGE